MYSYTVFLNKEKHQYQNDDLDALIIIVMDSFNKLNIKYDRDDLIGQIKRQQQKKDVVKKSPSIKEAFQGAKAILRFVSGNSASQEEIQRRSDICMGCPLMKRTSGCATCGAAKNVTLIAEFIQKTKKTPIQIPSSIKPEFCDVCGCSLATMVVTKYEDFYTEPQEKNSKRPDFCWLKTTSPNFTHE